MIRAWLDKPVTSRDRLIIIGIVMAVLCAEFASELGKTISEEIR